jgi:hypothetical protein
MLPFRALLLSLGVLMLVFTAAGCADTGGDDDASQTGDDDASQGDDDATAGDDDATGGDDDATGGDDDATAGDDDATAGDDDATADDDDATAGDDDATAGDDDATAGDDDLDHDGQTTAQGDCDDQDASTYTGADELCDSRDNNCNTVVDESPVDGTVYYQDADGDGHGVIDQTLEACSKPFGYATVGDDCNDAFAQINPDATEVCDGVDNDCDGVIDEGFDADNNGIPDCQAEEVCDGLDNNANGMVDEGFDVDGDGYTPSSCECRGDPSHCGLDCDDANASINPAASEVCDATDNNCDGAIDESAATDAKTWYQDADGDLHGDAGSSSEACYQPNGYVSSSDDCDDADAMKYPGNTETCDLKDNDCDGVIDDGVQTTYYADQDGDGHGDAQSAAAACSAPNGYVSSSDDCDDADATKYPGNTEVCDAKDNDCDGQVDDGATDAKTWYADNDGDTWGGSASTASCAQPTGYVSRSGDCQDGDKAVYPGAAEVCDGKDNDCEGTVDGPVPVDGSDWYQDADTDTWGNPEVKVYTCKAPSGYVDNGLDCDDTDPNDVPGLAGCPWPTGTELSCKDILDDGMSEGSGYYEIDPTGKGAFTVYCDMTTAGGGWTMVARLGAGTRSYTSIYRGTRFFQKAWLQGTTSYTLGANKDVVLGGSVYGMLDSVSLFDLASQLRLSCQDTTRNLKADAIWSATPTDLDAWLDTLTYSTAAKSMQFSRNGAAYALVNVYPTATEKYTWGSWHICGSSYHNEFTYAWQLGVCHNSPAEADSNLSNINQIAMGYHDGYTGLRLECTADTPSNSSQIDGSLQVWVR